MPVNDRDRLVRIVVGGVCVGVGVCCLNVVSAAAAAAAAAALSRLLLFELSPRECEGAAVAVD